MEHQSNSNTDLEKPDVFSAVNNYFLLFFALSCVMSSLYLQQLFTMIDQYSVGISVSAVLGIIAPIWLFTRRFATGFRRQLHIGLPRPVQVAYVIFATLAVVIIVDQIYLITQQFSPVPEEYSQSIRDLRPTSVGGFMIIFLGLCLMVPLAEEIIFRGVVQQVFARNMGPVLGFILAGLVFGAVHLNVHLLVSIAFFGVFLGFVFYATSNLTYTIIAHAVFNTVALLQLTFTPTTGDLPFYLRDVRIFVIALVLLVYLLYKMKQGGSELEPPKESSLPEA